jgi:perosamine synthetase
MIPLLKPSCTEEEIEAVAAVLRSGWWGNGPVCEQFEEEMVRRSDYKYCITVNSATAALHLALKSLNPVHGQEVIVPALTFISTAYAATYLGCKVIFADVRPDTLCIDWDDVLDKITINTLAVIAVDYAGYPAMDKPKVRLAGVPVIEDAAHNCLGEHTGDMVCYSFHPVKNLATGDGGAILTNNEYGAARLRSLRWLGIDRSTWERQEKKYNWDYDIREVGFKCHWNDIQAAVGLVQMRRLAAMNLRRREIAYRYREELVDHVEFTCDHPFHSNHLFPIRVRIDKRNAILDGLLAAGVSAGVHYKPLTHYPMYRSQATPPVTEREWQKLISLPIYPDMSDEIQDFIIHTVKEVINAKT